MNAPDSKRMLDLWSDGKDTADIALIMKVHESVIYNALASMGEQKTEPYRLSREKARESFESWGGWTR